VQSRSINNEKGRHGCTPKRPRNMFRTMRTILERSSHSYRKNPTDGDKLEAQNATLLSILPKGIPPALVAAIEVATHRAFTSHGLSAFEMSRDAAVAHEAGHTIVATAEGMVMQSVRIFLRSTPAGTAWGGWCEEASGKEWTTGPDSSVASDLSRARIIVAGLAGEAITGLDKPGSSLDELALSQLIGLNAAVKLRPRAERCGVRRLCQAALAREGVARHGGHPARESRPIPTTSRVSSPQ
jgi:hypothetical protein